MKNDSGEITMDEFSNTQENATEDKREEIATILIQYLFYKVKHNTPQRTNGIMVGTNAIVAICVLGVISHNVYFFSAVIGLAMADKLGRKMEWCK